MVKPKPGDLVCARTTDDTLIKKGSCGVIEGEEGKIKSTYMVTFNPSPMPWWWNGIINSSGGPSRSMKSTRMKDTGKNRLVNFQYFPGLPGAGRGKTKKKKVRVFEVNLK